MKALSKRLNGLVNLTIVSLPLLLWQSMTIAQPSPTVRANPPPIQKLNKAPKPNPNHPELPCLESRSECVELLAAKAIADLEVKSAELEAYRANLHRRKAEVKSQLREDVLDLVLEYEAAEREYVLAQSKLATYSQQRQFVEIDYQFGNGSTTQMLSMWQQEESLEAEVVKVEIKIDGNNQKTPTNN